MLLRRIWRGLEMSVSIPEVILKSRLIPAGANVLVGCSGGADSLALTEGLRQVSGELGIRLTVIHVHHHMRAESAEEDAVFVERFCREKGLPFVRKDVFAAAYAKEHGLSPEEAARVLRYACFEETARETGSTVVALAHHRDDVAETVLFQMIRGSGLRGLSGIPESRVSEGFLYVRPLISLGKAELEEWLREKGLSWRVDETNGVNEASRNRIRAEVLPALSGIRKDAAEKIAATADYLGEVDDYLRDEAERYILNEGEVLSDGSRTLPGSLSDKPHIFREYVFAAMLRAVGEPMKDKGRKQLGEVDDLLRAAVGRYRRFSGGTIVEKTYGGLRFCRKTGDSGRIEDEKTNPKPGELAVGMGESEEAVSEPEPGECAAGMAESPVRNQLSEYDVIAHLFPTKEGQIIPQKECTKWFDYDKIITIPVLRFREAGDMLSVAPGMHKKLKDWMIDEKIPAKERDRIPVLADGGEILWVAGFRMGEDYKITDKTKRVLELHLEKKERL